MAGVEALHAQLMRAIDALDDTSVSTAEVFELLHAAGVHLRLPNVVPVEPAANLRNSAARAGIAAAKALESGKLDASVVSDEHLHTFLALRLRLKEGAELRRVLRAHNEGLCNLATRLLLVRQQQAQAFAGLGVKTFRDSNRQVVLQRSFDRAHADIHACLAAMDAGAPIVAQYAGASVGLYHVPEGYTGGAYAGPPLHHTALRKVTYALPSGRDTLAPLATSGVYRVMGEVAKALEAAAHAVALVEQASAEAVQTAGTGGGGAAGATASVEATPAPATPAATAAATTAPVISSPPRPSASTTTATHRQQPAHAPPHAPLAAAAASSSSSSSSTSSMLALTTAMGHIGEAIRSLVDMEPPHTHTHTHHHPHPDGGGAAAAATTAGAATAAGIGGDARSLTPAERASRLSSLTETLAMMAAAVQEQLTAGAGAPAAGAGTPHHHHHGHGHPHHPHHLASALLMSPSGGASSILAAAAATAGTPARHAHGTPGGRGRCASLPSATGDTASSALPVDAFGTYIADGVSAVASRLAGAAASTYDAVVDAARTTIMRAAVPAAAASVHDLGVSGRRSASLATTRTLVRQQRGGGGSPSGPTGIGGGLASPSGGGAAAALLSAAPPTPGTAGTRSPSRGRRRDGVTPSRHRSASLSGSIGSGAYYAGTSIAHTHTLTLTTASTSSTGKASAPLPSAGSAGIGVQEVIHLQPEERVAAMQVRRQMANHDELIAYRSDAAQPGSGGLKPLSQPVLPAGSAAWPSPRSTLGARAVHGRSLQAAAAASNFCREVDTARAAAAAAATTAEGPAAHVVGQSARTKASLTLFDKPGLRTFAKVFGYLPEDDHDDDGHGSGVGDAATADAPAAVTGGGGDGPASAEAYEDEAAAAAALAAALQHGHVPGATLHGGVGAAAHVAAAVETPASLHHQQQYYFHRDDRHDAPSRHEHHPHFDRDTHEQHQHQPQHDEAREERIAASAARLAQYYLDLAAGRITGTGTVTGTTSRGSAASTRPPSPAAGRPTAPTGAAPAPATPATGQPATATSNASSPAASVPASGGGTVATAADEAAQLLIQRVAALIAGARSKVSAGGLAQALASAGQSASAAVQAMVPDSATEAAAAVVQAVLAAGVTAGGSNAAGAAAVASTAPGDRDAPSSPPARGTGTSAGAPRHPLFTAASPATPLAAALAAAAASPMLSVSALGSSHAAAAPAPLSSSSLSSTSSAAPVFGLDISSLHAAGDDDDDDDDEAAGMAVPADGAHGHHVWHSHQPHHHQHHDAHHHGHHSSTTHHHQQQQFIHQHPQSQAPLSAAVVAALHATPLAVLPIPSEQPIVSYGTTMVSTHVTDVAPHVRDGLLSYAQAHVASAVVNALPASAAAGASSHYASATAIPSSGYRARHAALKQAAAAAASPAVGTARGPASASTRSSSALRERSGEPLAIVIGGGGSSRHRSASTGPATAFSPAATSTPARSTSAARLQRSAAGAAGNSAASSASRWGQPLSATMLASPVAGASLLYHQAQAAGLGGVLGDWSSGGGSHDPYGMQSALPRSRAGSAASPSGRSSPSRSPAGRRQAARAASPAGDHLLRTPAPLPPSPASTAVPSGLRSGRSLLDSAQSAAGHRGGSPSRHGAPASASRFSDRLAAAAATGSTATRSQSAGRSPVRGSSRSPSATSRRLHVARPPPAAAGGAGYTNDPFVLADSPQSHSIELGVRVAAKLHARAAALTGAHQVPPDDVESTNDDGDAVVLPGPLPAAAVSYSWRRGELSGGLGKVMPADGMLGGGGAATRMVSTSSDDYAGPMEPDDDGAYYSSYVPAPASFQSSVVESLMAAARSRGGGAVAGVTLQEAEGDWL